MGQQQSWPQKAIACEERVHRFLTRDFRNYTNLLSTPTHVDFQPPARFQVCHELRARTEADEAAGALALAGEGDDEVPRTF